MSLDLAALGRAVAAHGPVIRVVVAAVAGSAPREVGAAMLVWQDGQAGTIGGGALEHRAVRQARAMLDVGADLHLDRVALGPALGQCCGGAVTLLAERYGPGALSALAGALVHARPLTPDAPEPLAVRRLVARTRDRGALPAPRMLDGWMVEPVTAPGLPLWIYGAGHVGRALVDVLAPLPEFAITWVDTGPGRFPDQVPGSVAIVPAAAPAMVARRAPAGAHHLILTYSHALDLELCHALLETGFASAGLIGSATKWARFRARLAALGHSDARIARIACPIGKPEYGKHPQAIAVGTASTLLDMVAAMKTDRESPRDRQDRTGSRALDDRRA